MGRSSRGGPGNMTNHDRRPSARNGFGEASIIKPGAVPWRLGTTIAPCGTMASTRVRGGTGRPRDWKNPWMDSLTAASNTSVRPNNSAMRSRVMSSQVGPSPPVVITRSARPNPSRTACWMSSPRSDTNT